MTAAGLVHDTALHTRVSGATARLYGAHHDRTEMTVDTCVGRDVVVCTFRSPGAHQQKPRAGAIGFPEGSENELIDAVQRLTSRRVVALVNAGESDPEVAGQMFFLEPNDQELPRFRVSVEPLKGGAIVGVEGDFDRGTAAEVDQVARGQIDGDGTRLVLDLSRTRFIDAAAIHLIEALSSRAANAGGTVLVLAPCGRARWLLDLISPREELRVVGSLEEAMAAWPVPGLTRSA